MTTTFGPGDPQTWPAYTGHSNDPRRALDYWECLDCGGEHDVDEACPEACTHCGHVGLVACCRPCVVCDSRTDVTLVEGEPLCRLCAGGDVA